MWGRGTGCGSRRGIRGLYHPGVSLVYNDVTAEEEIDRRDENDDGHEAKADVNDGVLSCGLQASKPAYTLEKKGSACGPMSAMRRRSLRRDMLVSNATLMMALIASSSLEGVYRSSTRTRSKSDLYWRCGSH